MADQVGIVKKIETIAPGLLNPSAYNPRTISPQEFAKLRRSLREFGFVEPVVVNNGNKIIGGHQRVRAAIEEGLKRVPIVRLNLALNRISGEWDLPLLKDLLGQLSATPEFDVEMTGFDIPEIDKLIREDEDEPVGLDQLVDEGEGLLRKWRVKRGQLWKAKGEAAAGHKIYCGDSAEPGAIGHLLRSGIDFLFSSPPYNIGLPYTSHNDGVPDWQTYGAFLKSVLGLWVPMLKSGRALGWNIGVFHKTYHIQQQLMLQELGLNFYRQLIWQKVGVPLPKWHISRQNSRARVFTPNYTHELVLIYIKGKLEKGGKILLDELCENDVFQLHQSLSTRDVPEGTVRSGGAANMKKRSFKVHPAVFPVRLPGMFIANLCDYGEVVADPFAGLGTTAIAAEARKRGSITSEIEPKYVAVALERLKNLGLKPRLAK